MVHRPIKIVEVECMNFGVLTGGGDSAGINDFLYFLAKRLESEGHTLTGFRSSWLGMVNNDAISLNSAMLAPIATPQAQCWAANARTPLRTARWTKCWPAWKTARSTL